MKRAAVFAFIALLSVAAVGLTVVATPSAQLKRGDKVTICHATSSEKNPYNQQSPDVDGVLSGHDGHPNDIIPPFVYEAGPGESGSYPGKNWDVEGQAIWAYGCNPLPDVTPIFACVDAQPGGLLAHFGYQSSESNAVNIEVGLANTFEPSPENRGQPVTFQPGTHRDVFQVPFSGGSLTWRLAGKSVPVSADSPRCQASIRIDKALTPATDQGRFDLLLDGKVLAPGVGQGGTTGARAVSAIPGGTQHTVGEQAAAGTKLGDYATTIVCRDNDGRGVTVAEGEGTTITLTVSPGQAIVCVVSNVRGDIPGPGHIDLQIIKTATPRTLLVGGQVTWGVTVKNKGPDTATNVVVEDALPDDVSFVEGSLVVPAGVTCVGARCTLASLAAGASVTGRFVTTVTAVGQKTNTVTVDADQEDVNPADNAASAQVVVTGRDEEIVSPILECVDRVSGGTYRAHFGYLNQGNDAVSVPIGVRNSFAPAPEDRGQPRRFQPGRAADVFQVEFDGTLVWTLTGRASTATSGSKSCGPSSGSLRVDKILRPTTDGGRFNLEIDGVPAGTGRSVGHLGTTGDVSVAPGRHRVGEEGVSGTSLANYDTTIVCRPRQGRGAVSSAFEGPELVVDVPAGGAVVCTITNSRRSEPTPPPEPPPAPTPLPPPAPGTSDLGVLKLVDRRTGDLGDVVTWTVIVTNYGPVAATDVRITDAAAAGATFVSLSVSQGKCARTTCSLGTIPPAGSVRIVARTRALTVGARLNTVVVRGDQPDSNPQNNVASAIVRVLSSFTPPLVQRCGRLTIDRRVAQAGTPVRVRARVKNVFGRPLRRTLVRARGAGLSTVARTNGKGLATLRLAPTRVGIVRLTVDARTLSAAGARRCTAGLGVMRRRVVQPSVTG